MSFQIIDVDTHFGIHPAKGEFPIDTLISSMQRQGIAYGMAYCLSGVTFNARKGNEEVLAAAGEHSEILPVATLDPRPHYGVEEEAERIAAGGFVACRLFPELQGWSVESLLFRKILKLLDDNKMPVIIAAGTGAGASAIAQQAANVRTPIILTGVTYFTWANAIEAAKAAPNIYISTQLLDVPYAAEIMVDTLGAERYVFGSGSPAAYSRPALSVILGSSLSDEDKEKILAGNIRRILGLKGSKLNRRGEDGAYASWAIAQPIIDVHCHFGPWQFPAKAVGIEDTLAMMRRWGIEKAILSSSEAIQSDFVRGNRELASAIEGHPELLGYVTVNPNYPERSREEMDAYLAQPNFVGVKIHPAYCGQAINSSGIKALASEIEKRGVPLLIHTYGAGEPAKVEELANHAPGLSIIMGHGGAGAWREAAQVLSRTKNTYAEFCASFCDRGKVEESVRIAGADRILFGSDMDLIAPEYILGMYEEAGLLPEDQAKVMHSNAARLFHC